MIDLNIILTCNNDQNDLDNKIKLTTQLDRFEISQTMKHKAYIRPYFCTYEMYKMPLDHLWFANATSVFSG